MFEGESLARTYSQEHLERHRSTSLSSRRSGQPSFAPAAKSISRGVPAETVHEHDDEHHHSDQSTTPTLADPETTDVEANRGEKQQGEKTAPLHAGNEDPFFVGLKGREHISPHTWCVVRAIIADSRPAFMPRCSLANLVWLVHSSLALQVSPLPLGFNWIRWIARVECQ